VLTGVVDNQMKRLQSMQNSVQSHFRSLYVSYTVPLLHFYRNCAIPVEAVSGHPRLQPGSTGCISCQACRQAMVD